MRWVWDANCGKPVRENATLTFGANKGVVGLDLLSSGNLVLCDSKGNFVWQRFNHPTHFCFVMEQRHWAMYYQSKNAKKPLLYYKSDEFGDGKGALAYLVFYCEAEYASNYAFELGFRFNLSNSDSLLGWSKACTPPMLPPCKDGTNVDYYKVDGVEHYTSEYNEGAGPMNLAQYKDKCSKDCKCLGLFYRVESSKCLYFG
ncbi:hypothetical protein Pfo_012817 [Paulownia fortunei]|nr:hypothetical protein Pfo_012817 [Paulownia fortunei]